MCKRYCIVNDADGNIKESIDTSGCPVDGAGDVSEADAAITALNQLGWILCETED